MTAISRRTLTDTVSEELTRMIADLSVGDSLPPTGELARRYDVSVIVIREAIAQLAGQGVVSRRQGREPIVTMPGPEVLADTLVAQARHRKIPSEDFLICRAALEVEAAALAAGQPEAHRRELEGPLEELRHANTAKEFTDADLALHLAIVKLSGNAALEVLLAALQDMILREMARRTRKEADAVRHQSLEAHERIVEAIVSGNVGEARAAMSDHFAAALPHR